ncbi:hypothetical protein [Chryseosolibacter indicus]|uniref:Uncharacterized protein n=1 Tax=Chryseosolibacter indicus TaxID=2782351 RepID=A0ABS5VNX6_9BACT|nr:hypothetical protein [Chryseosolibacter indicus]MBT1703056.1 hypothetical protein [Chryseosolibacter indicus]
MAILRTESIVQGFSGAVGNLVLRQVGGKTILSKAPARPGKQSELQKENRQKFKMASIYAKTILKDPKKKAYYQQKARKLKLPNAYTAAITDYMRKGEIRDIDTRKFKGKTGDVVAIKVHKQDFTVSEVRVKILNAAGDLLASGVAKRKDTGQFSYKLTTNIGDVDKVRIKVVLGGFLQDEISKEVTAFLSR